MLISAYKPNSQLILDGLKFLHGVVMAMGLIPLEMLLLRIALFEHKMIVFMLTDAEYAALVFGQMPMDQLLS